MFPCEFVNFSFTIPVAFHIVFFYFYFNPSIPFNFCVFLQRHFCTLHDFNFRQLFISILLQRFFFERAKKYFGRSTKKIHSEKLTVVNGLQETFTLSVLLPFKRISISFANVVSISYDSMNRKTSETFYDFLLVLKQYYFLYTVFFFFTWSIFAAFPPIQVCDTFFRFYYYLPLCMLQ